VEYPKHIVEKSYDLYFQDKYIMGKNTEIVRMYDLSFRVNLVYKPKTIWFWIKKLINKIFKKWKTKP